MTGSPEVDALEQAVGRFAVPLRMGDGIDDLALAGLYEALRNCAAAWQGKDLIPKQGASILAELFPAIEGCADIYDPDYARRVLDCCITLHDLVMTCTTDPAADNSSRPEEHAVSGDDALVDGMHVTLRLRHDFTITNAQQLLAAARAAYVADNTEASQRDAEEAVTGPADVMFTLLERDGLLGETAETTLASHASYGLQTDGWRAQVTINETRHLERGQDCFDQGEIFALPPDTGRSD